MKKIFKIILAFSMLLGLVACGGEVKKDTKKDTLSMVTEAIRTLDSVKATDTASFNIVGNTQETLMVYKDNKPVPGAAKSYTISKDGKTYTFKLRKNLVWSDGKPLTSKDYKFAWMRLIDPNVGASYAFFLFGVQNAKDFYLNQNSIKAADVGIMTPDDETIIINLEHPLPFFTQLVAFPALAPQRADLLAKYKETYGSKPQSLAFSGPYMVKSWAKGSKAVLIKNPKYWNAKNIQVKKIDLLELKEQSTQYQMFANGQLDALVGLSGEYIKRLEEGANEGKWKELKLVSPRTDFISFNFKTKKALLSKKVRMAFSLATNRVEFVEKILKANTPAFGLVSPGILVGDINYREKVAQPLQGYGANIDPKALFVEGLKEQGLDPNPGNYTFDLLLKKNTADAKTQGEYLKQAWESKLGVHIVLEPSADFSDYLQKKANGKFDLLFQGWGADYNSPLSFLDLFTTTNGINSGKYSNKEVDFLINQLNVITDPSKRIEIFSQIEYIYLIKDPAIAPLFYKSINFFVKPFVHDLQVNLFGAPYEYRWMRLGK